MACRASGDVNKVGSSWSSGSASSAISRRAAACAARVAAQLSLFGEQFDPDRALRLGVLDELVPAGQVAERTVAVAESVPDDCLEHYAFTKRAAQAAALRDIAELADPPDEELPTWFTSPDARHAHRRYWQQLKGTTPTW